MKEDDQTPESMQEQRSKFCVGQYLEEKMLIIMDEDQHQGHCYCDMQYLKKKFIASLKLHSETCSKNWY